MELFRTTVRKKCYRDPEKTLIITGTIYSNCEMSEQFLVTEYFFNLLWRFLMSNELEQL